MGSFFAIASLIVLLVGSMMLLMDAFGEGMLWGLGCLLAPLPVALLFVMTHWHQSKTSFYVLTGGAILMAAARYS